jgi:hypothetical protein
MTPTEVGLREGLRRIDPRERRYSKKVQLLAAWIMSILVGTTMLALVVAGRRFDLDNLLSVAPIVSVIATVTFLFIVIPKVHWSLGTALNDAGRGLRFYIVRGCIVAFLFCFIPSLFSGSAFPVVFVVLVLAIFPAALAAATMFGILNKCVIRKELAALAN